VPVLTACGPWLLSLLSVALGTREASAAVVHASPEYTEQLLAAAMGAVLPARALGGWLSGALLAGVAVGLALGAWARRAEGRTVAGAALGGLVGLGLLGVAAAGAVPPMSVQISDNLGLFLPAAAGAVALCLAAASVGNDGDKASTPGMGIACATAAGLALAATAAGLSSLSLGAAADGLRHAPPDTRLAVLGRGVAAASASDPVVLYAGGLAALGLVAMAVWGMIRASNPRGVALSAATVGLVAVASCGADYGATANLATALAPDSERLYTLLDDFEPLELEHGVSGRARMAVDDKQAVVGGASVFMPDGAAPPQPTTLELAFASVSPMGPSDLDAKRSPARVEIRSRGPEAHPAIDVAVHRHSPRKRLHEILKAAEDNGFHSLTLVGRPTEFKLAAAALEFRLSRPLLQHTRGVRVFLGSSLPKLSVDHDEPRQPVWQSTITASGPVELTDLAQSAKPLHFELGTAPTRLPERGYALVLLGDGVDAQRLAVVAAHLDRADIDTVVLREPRPNPNLVPSKTQSPGLGSGETFGTGLGNIGGIGTLDTLAPPGGVGGRAPARVLPNPTGGDKSIVLGALSKPVIQAVIRRRLRAVKKCYEQELQNSPKLQGRVVIKIVISASGKVSSAEVKESTVPSEPVGACVAEVMRKAQFPAPKGGGIVIVSYPFVFKPGP
jgi:TonB family protein